VALPTGCVYDFPTSSEGMFPDIVDAQKKRQYTPGFISTLELSRNVRESRFWEEKNVGTQIRHQPEVMVTMLA
jgi:hypothetical protein